MVEVLFDPNQGIEGLIRYLAVNSDGWFFVIALITIFLVAFIPMVMRWGFDWSFLSASSGVLLLAIPLYFAGGIDEKALFGFILLFALSLLKATIFKED